MNLANVTRNQHFLPQVEQRLNTSTPDAAVHNQRIYEFAIQGRGDDTKLGEPSNPRIRVNLALDDVFSFDVAPAANLRHNFEVLFQKYEDQLVACTTAVLEKAAANTRGDDIRDDLMALFAAKFLNFMRNPFSVPKMLDTFGRVATLRPTDKEKDEQLDLVLNGSKPRCASSLS
jgi:hypothetical protein